MALITSRVGRAPCGDWLHADGARPGEAAGDRTAPLLGYVFVCMCVCLCVVCCVRCAVRCVCCVVCALCVCVGVCALVCVGVCWCGLSYVCLSVVLDHMSVCLSICLSVVSVFVCTPVCMSICVLCAVQMTGPRRAAAANRLRRRGVPPICHRRWHGGAGIFSVRSCSLLMGCNKLHQTVYHVFAPQHIYRITDSS